MPIPKGKNWDGKLENTRPIMLLESTRKLLFKIITQRLWGIISQSEFLPGGNYGFFPEKSAKDAIMTGRCLVDIARLKKKQLFMLCIDIKKAYDSVSWESLEKVLERLRFSKTFRELIKDIFERREMQVRTAYGYTEPFKPSRGLEQGDIISPLLWLCFYDPLLTALNISEKGFKCNEQKRIAHITFADDNTLCAGSLEDLKTLVEIAEDFYKSMGIEVNVNKWVLAVLSEIGKVEAIRNPIEINGIKIKKIEGPKTAIRILGGWIKLGGSVVRSVEEVIKKVKAIRDRLEHRAIPVVGIRYVMNNMMKPIISYGATGLGIKESHFQKIFRSYSKNMKKMLKLPRSTPTSLMTAIKGWEIEHPRDYIVEENIKQVERLMNGRNDLSQV